MAFFLSIFFYSQSQWINKDTLRGEFTYLLKAKLDQRNDYKHEELFSLQVGDNRAFFVSSQSIKRDSVIKNSAKITTEGNTKTISLQGVAVPKTKFSYTIIQSNENIQFFQLVAMSLLSYKEPIISNWKLSDELQTINSFNCKKAEVTFKGRNWIAWYSTEIPFPYGPYKFTGLPGLIIKITDDRGDYDFELVKSVPNVKLKGRLINNISDYRYTNPIETTRPKFEQALENARANPSGALANSGTTIIGGQEVIQQRRKQREENKKYENPIELE